MQSNLARALAAFPDSSPNLKAHGLVNQYQAPGLRGMFKTIREYNTIIATREKDGFRMEIDVGAALASNEPSRTTCMELCGMRYPYPEIDSVNRFFLPASAIKCKVRVADGDNGMEDIVCEGYICLRSKEIKVDCIDLKRHAYFWYVIGANCMAFC